MWLLLAASTIAEINGVHWLCFVLFVAACVVALHGNWEGGEHGY
jgi:hypothetical protein